jgi:tetratricopeptide (TPR) repeat protein
LTRMNPFRWFDDDPTPPPAKSSSTTRAPVPEPGEPESGSSPRASARYAYERIAAPKPGNRTDARRHFDRGASEQSQGRHTQAITEYLAAVQADPAYFEAYYNLGLAATAAGHLPRALSAYERALSIKPTDLTTRLNFALALQKGGYPRDAANELEALLAAQPDEVRAHLALANLYAKELAQPARARPHYLKVLDLQPRHSQAAAIQQWLNAHP